MEYNSFNLALISFFFFYLISYVNSSLALTARNVDPEVNMNASELIRNMGYPCEEYDVHTPDGFYLTIQRIPFGRNETKYTPRPVVLLQHGLLCSSTNWISNLANESFGFILADAGYDVWLGNARGNTYGMKNDHTDPTKDDFWAWSWDEMANYDLPSTINFALKISNQTQLYYAGHSQGTTIAFAAFSRNKKLADKVKTFFALAPVTTVGTIKSPMRYMAYFLPEIRFLFDLFGVKEFLPNTMVMKWLAEDVCTTKTEIFCANVLFVLCGFDENNLNMSRLPVYLSHTPSGTSVQNMVHFAQMVKSKKYEMYDYGSDDANMQNYNQATPPLYFPENMTTPTIVFAGGNDTLADPDDVKGLLPRIKNLVKYFFISEYDHLDFIWGLDAAEKIYHPIVKMMKSNEEQINLKRNR